MSMAKRGARIAIANVNMQSGRRFPTVANVSCGTPIERAKAHSFRLYLTLNLGAIVTE